MSGRGRGRARRGQGRGREQGNRDASQHAPNATDTNTTGPGQGRGRARGRGRGRGRPPIVLHPIGPDTNNPPPPPPVAPTPTNVPAWNPSVDEVRRVGLHNLRFDDNDINRVGQKKNERRFRSNYGVGSRAIHRLILDLQTTMTPEARINKINPKYLFLTLFWLKTYNTYDQMEGFWSLSVETIGLKVIEYTKKIKGLKAEKVRSLPPLFFRVLTYLSHRITLDSVWRV
jgi:hypothetical protein